MEFPAFRIIHHDVLLANMQGTRGLISWVVDMKTTIYFIASHLLGRVISIRGWLHGQFAVIPSFTMLSLKSYLAGACCLLFGNHFMVHAGSIYETRFPGVTWDNDNWVLRTTNLDQGHYQSRMSIANGYLGINVAAVGPFFEVDVPVNGDNINGWPLFSTRQTFATISGFFDQQPTTNGSNFPWLNQYGGESVISGVPHWGGLIVELPNGQHLDATVARSTISNFSSTLDIRRGLSTWQYTWTPDASQDLSFQIMYRMFASKLFVNQGFIELQIQPSQDCNVSIASVLDGRSAVRTDFVTSGVDGQHIYTAVSPSGVLNVSAYLYATIDGSAEVSTPTTVQISKTPYLGVNDSSIAQSVNAYLKPDRVTTVTKYVGGASSDGFVDPRSQARDASLSAKAVGFDQALVYHAAEWVNVMPKDSVDDYSYQENSTLPSDPNIIEAAITAVTNPYYLLSNTISQDALANVNDAPIDTNSISVGGLTSDSYAGLVFWDAEIWMQPGIAVAFPQAAKQIANYRVVRYAQAKANAQTAYTSSKNGTTFSSNAAVYPWTSGRHGNCTGTGPCFDYEYHINGDILQEFTNYWVTSGDTNFFLASLLPIYESVATFYSELLSKNGSSYVLTNMTDPDEYANNVDNGGYTMPLISDVLQNANVFRELLGLENSTIYGDQAANILVSRNIAAGIIDEYTGMNGSIAVKQADVVLDTFPLNYQTGYTAQDSLRDLNYYAGKQSLNGPGMTYAIFSIVASQVSRSGCSSYTYQQYSEQPYARAPWFQLSEQLVDDYNTNGGTHPAYPFLTGMGGANQVTVFGYLGLRLTADFTLHVDPSLPPQIPHLRYRTFYWHGWPISAAANETHTVLTRLERPYMDANMTFANASIRVNVGNGASAKYELPPKGTLTLVNRDVAKFKTVENNIAQCLPVSSSQAFQPGQFPISAVDGAASTKWQPVLANVSQSITVDLSSQPFQSIKGLYFDWAQNPPTNFTVYFHNMSDVDVKTTGAVISMTMIAISNPYNATEASLIVPYMSNTTNVTFTDPVYSGKYATLMIQGNQGDPITSNQRTGATVAEFAIIAA